MESEGSSLCSQELATGPYAEPLEFCSHTMTITHSFTSQARCDVA
jgi:hypothetical protein